jgi:hypothetical protein
LFLLVALVLIVAIAAAAIGAAAGAVVAALPLWLIARVPPAKESIDYQLAYRASFLALLTWIVATSVVGFGAEALRSGGPGAWEQWVRDTADASKFAVAQIAAAATAWVPWPEESLSALTSGAGATGSFGFATASTESALFAPEVFAVLVLLPLLGAAIALRLTLPFNGFSGIVRACIGAALVVASGLASLVALLVGLVSIAVHARTAPLPEGWQIGSLAALIAAVLGAAAAAAALLGGPLFAIATGLVTRGRAFPFGTSLRVAGFAGFVAVLVTALALYLFRYADAYVANVDAAVAARALIWPSWAAIRDFSVVALPGVLLGALVMRGATPLFRGVLGYLAVCAIFAPIALALSTAALAAGIVALDSPQIGAWLR